MLVDLASPVEMQRAARTLRRRTVLTVVGRYLLVSKTVPRVSKFCLNESISSPANSFSPFQKIHTQHLRYLAPHQVDGVDRVPRTLRASSRAIYAGEYFQKDIPTKSLSFRLIYLRMVNIH